MPSTSPAFRERSFSFPKRRESDDTGSKISQDSKRLAHSKESRSALAGELAVLKDMESRREGLKAAVKNILTNRSTSNPRFDYIVGILADIIRADFKYATAMEAALEDKTDTLVINDMDKLLADTETIEKLDSRAHFLCINKIAPFASKEDLSGIESIKGRLVEFVKYDPKYAPLVWKLLGKTLVVDSLASAAELTKNEEGIFTLHDDPHLEAETLNPGRQLVAFRRSREKLSNYLGKVPAHAILDRTPSCSRSLMPGGRLSS